MLFCRLLWKGMIWIHAAVTSEVKIAVHRQPVVLDFYWLVQNDALLGSNIISVPVITPLHSMALMQVTYFIYAHVTRKITYT